MTPRRVTRAAVAGVAVVAVLVFAGGAWPKNIHGTVKSDRLTGTLAGDTIEGVAGDDTIYGLAGSDRLFGGGGRDRLYGGPGNDRVYGGPGADVIACGAGADIAFADATDKVAKDCETVKGLPAKPPPPPPPPPPPLVRPGHYASVGGNVSFDVAADGVTLSNLSVARIGTQCQPAGLRLFVPVAVTSSITIQPDRTFSVDFQGTTGLMPKLSMRGAFDDAGNASGTLSIYVSVDLGTHYECDSGAIAWTANLQQ